MQAIDTLFIQSIYTQALTHSSTQPAMHCRTRALRSGTCLVFDDSRDKSYEFQNKCRIPHLQNVRTAPTHRTREPACQGCLNLRDMKMCEGPAWRLQEPSSTQMSWMQSCSHLYYFCRQRTLCGEFPAKRNVYVWSITLATYSRAK